MEQFLFKWLPWLVLVLVWVGIISAAWIFRDRS
jgi:hypothetical protein